MISLVRRHAPSPMLVQNVANGILFNIFWLAIVVTHSAALAPLIVVAHLSLHFSLMGRGLTEARFILVITLFGFALDQLLFALGVFTISGKAALAPLWISCLWPVLATTFMHAFSSLQSNRTLAIIFGAAGGAASYIAGTGLSDVEFSSSFWGPIILAILWAQLFPSLLWFARVTAGQQKGACHVAT